MIRQHYEMAGFVIGRETPGQTVTKEFQGDIRRHLLAPLFAFLDEFIFLLRYVSYYFMSCVPVGGVTNVKAATFNKMALKMLSDLAAIRGLCAIGLDGSARMLLRLLYETAILWCRFLLDEASRFEFENATTPKASNEFWHKYIARNKSRTYVRGKMHELGMNWMGDYQDGKYLDAANELMGIASHPSFLMASLAMDVDFKQPTENFAVREPILTSHFTLCTTIFIVILPFSFTPDLDYNLISIDMLQRGEMFPANSRTKTWDEYSRYVRLMFMSQFFAAIEFMNGLHLEVTAQLSGDTSMTASGFIH